MLSSYSAVSLWQTAKRCGIFNLFFVCLFVIVLVFVLITPI